MKERRAERAEVGGTETHTVSGVVASAAGGPRMALLVSAGGDTELALLEPGAPLTVGRAAPAQVCVNDRTLSREHARFVLDQGRVLVEDLGSKNGVFIEGRRVDRAALEAGDEVRLGAVRVRVQALDAEGPAEARESGERLRSALDEDLSWPVAPGEPGEGLVAGRALREVLATAERVAASRAPVILHGETGTGKEEIARLLHERSPRRGRRMVRVNCGALPKDLIESALFGHERGAFTGAVQQQKGVFEEADGGTVFLDEIGELTPAAQAALLRVLETGSFSRVGSTREITVDVRVVCATHRDLLAMAAEGTFREDLYYRLGGVVLELPPLRARTDEVEPLARRFLRAANGANGRSVQGIAPEALALLRVYSWPGNVRELRNAVERAVVVARGARIEPADLPERVRAARGALEAAEGAREAAAALAGQAATPSTTPPPPAEAGPVRGAVQGYEARLLREALEAAGWSRTKAASQLGMPVRTLSYRMKVLGLKKPEA